VIYSEVALLHLWNSLPSVKKGLFVLSCLYGRTVCNWKPFPVGFPQNVYSLFVYVKLLLRLIKHHMGQWGDNSIHQTSEIDANEWSALCSGSFTPREESNQVLINPKAQWKLYVPPDLIISNYVFCIGFV
jgi:hypothetical protein